MSDGYSVKWAVVGGGKEGWSSRRQVQTPSVHELSEFCWKLRVIILGQFVLSIYRDDDQIYSR